MCTEVLLPPLTGIEALNSDVEGSILVIHSRLSLNLAAQTLEQVLSRRRKMLMDMATGIELELRDTLSGQLNLVPVALKILRKALAYGAYSHSPEWFNNDDNFAKIMQETLYLQRILVDEVKRLDYTMDKPELNLRGWKAGGPARILLLAGWVHSRPPGDVVIDLRDSHLTPNDGQQLAELLSAAPRLTAVDVRGNESLGEDGVKALSTWMKSQRIKNSTSVPRSLCGVTPKNSRLDIPKEVLPGELKLLCSELEANVFAEGVAAGMGGGKGKGVSQLNRRGVNAADSWIPLAWAAKDNHLLIAQQLLEEKHPVNQQEPMVDKGSSGYAPLHWASQKGHVKMVELLMSSGADVSLNDKHGNTPKQLAEKKGLADVVALLEAPPPKLPLSKPVESERQARPAGAVVRRSSRAP